MPATLNGLPREDAAGPLQHALTTLPVLLPVLATRHLNICMLLAFFCTRSSGSSRVSPTRRLPRITVPAPGAREGRENARGWAKSRRGCGSRCGYAGTGFGWMWHMLCATGPLPWAPCCLACQHGALPADSEAVIDVKQKGLLCAAAACCACRARCAGTQAHTRQQCPYKLLHPDGRCRGCCARCCCAAIAAGVAGDARPCRHRYYRAGGKAGGAQGGSHQLLGFAAEPLALLCWELVCWLWQGGRACKSGSKKNGGERRAGGEQQAQVVARQILCCLTVHPPTPPHPYTRPPHPTHRSCSGQPPCRPQQLPQSRCTRRSAAGSPLQHPPPAASNL